MKAEEVKGKMLRLTAVIFRTSVQVWARGFIGSTLLQFATTYSGEKTKAIVGGTSP